VLPISSTRRLGTLESVIWQVTTAPPFHTRSRLSGQVASAS
jgi:hypothetical protein